jgi:hypothetical protein
LVGCDESLTRIPTNTTEYPLPNTCFALGESGETLILMAGQNHLYVHDKTGQIAESVINLPGRCVAIVALEGRLMLFSDNGVFIPDLAELR